MSSADRSRAGTRAVLFLLCLTASVQTGPASAAPAGSPVTATVSHPAIFSGSTQTVQIVGLPPGRSVTGRADGAPEPLGVVTSDARGRATLTFAVPPTLPPGDRLLSLSTDEVTATESFTVVPAPHRDAVLLGAVPPPQRDNQAAATVPADTDGPRLPWRLVGVVLLLSAAALGATTLRMKA